MPGDTKALERLAVLMVPLGRIKESEELHRQKAEIDRAHDKYRKMLFDGDDLSSPPNCWASSPAHWASVRQPGMVDPGRGPFARPESGGGICSIIRDRSPLPPALAAKAVELSSPYKLITASHRQPGRNSIEQLAALAPTDGPVVAAVSQKLARSPRATIDFVDDAPKAGLRFVFDNGKTPERLLPETMSGGLGLIDYDGDGWLDVVMVTNGHVNENQRFYLYAMPSRLYENRPECQRCLERAAFRQSGERGRRGEESVLTGANTLASALRAPSSPLGRGDANSMRIRGGCRSSFDDGLPAQRDALPRGLIGRFEHDGNVATGLEEKGHLRQRIAYSYSFNEGAHAHFGFISRQGQGLTGWGLVFFVGQRLPVPAMDSVRVSASGWNQVEDEEVNVLTQ